MPEAYFTTRDGEWFLPTDYTRGPWDPHSCHAGPPAALMVRALERLVPSQRLVRLTVELPRPIPMGGFRVRAEVRREGRSVTLTQVEICDDERVYAQGFGMHLRTLEHLEVTTPTVTSPEFEKALPGPFPIRHTLHSLTAFNSSIEARYDPEGSQGEGGPTVVWMRSKVPILPGEEPSGFQAICPLADSGNGISWNQYLDEVLFVNPDLEISLHREPEGEWFCSKVISHWNADGTGMADASLFDRSGPLGRAVQNLLLMPAGG